MGRGSQKERERMTGHRHVCSMQTREPLCEGFDKIGPHTKLLSNIIKIDNIGGEAAGRGCAVRDATLDWDTATADTASVTGRRACG
jgi:hypothetical protein